MKIAEWLFYAALAAVVAPLAFLWWRGCDGLKCIGWTAEVLICEGTYLAVFFFGLVLLLVSAFRGPPKPVLRVVVVLAAGGVAYMMQGYVGIEPFVFLGPLRQLVSGG